jgi:hypothetical protein
MNYQHDTIDRVRSIMAPANPVARDAATGSAADRQGLETLRRVLAQPPEKAARARQHGKPAENRRAWRVTAPAAAAVAIGGLAIGLTLVAQSPKAHLRPPATGAPTAAGQGMPGYYVTLSLLTQNMIAAVHDSRTGRVLSQIRVPGARGVYPNIAADGADRSYVLTGTVAHPTQQEWRHGTAEPVFYRLRVSADGRSETLTRLSVNVQPLGSGDVLTGMAVSPGSSELALALETSNSRSSSLNFRGEIVLYSLTGGPSRTWTAPGDQPALPVDLNWISKSHLAFVWQDQLTGSGAYFFTGRSQIRVLDTSAPGHDLLASRVLLTGGGKLGFIQTAEVGPDGSPITVATFRVTSVGGSGTATMLLAQVAPNGAVEKTFATYTRSYSGLPQEGAITTPCRVLATDATGRYTLTTCPGFGRIANATLTPLAASSGDYTTAW